MPGPTTGTPRFWRRPLRFSRYWRGQASTRRSSSGGWELAQGLREALTRHGAVGTAHHVGPVVQCLPGAAGPPTFDAFLAADWSWYDVLTVELLRRGVFTLPGGRWYLSVSHTAEDVSHTNDVIGDAVAATIAQHGHPHVAASDGHR